jgi:hypothetical protein
LEFGIENSISNSNLKLIKETPITTGITAKVLGVPSIAGGVS